ncbi:MAG: helix-turn-helix domain-containing protein, partial [Pseudomonadota bacterium]|nr:helix-turn-helix domain-containing protein [Pseudomonadota bacterium]
TNRDLQAAMEEGSFRQDLFYRLSVVPIEVPPLRTRIDDIKLLAEFFCESYAKDLGSAACTFSKAALTAMQGYDWPGNVRQLKNAVEWCMIMRPAGSEDEIALEDLPPEISNLPQKKADKDDSAHTISYQLASLPLREARETFEREYLVSQMNKFGGNISKTADFVGMERSALHRKMKQLGIQTVSKQNSNDSDESSDAVDYRESA